MDQQAVDGFVRDGFVKLEGAFSPQVAAACEQLLWEQIDAKADDRSTWKRPVYWVDNMAQPPFAAAAGAPALHDAFDALVGAGRWQPRRELGGFPLRFPHVDEPDDAGWHIEGAYMPPDESSYFTNVHSSYRALLTLFLFTDVGMDDAPTRIRIGSHRDVPHVLRPYGEIGASGDVLSPLVDAASAGRPVTFATGKAGDVFVCHPFLVHAAQPHRGTRPRFLAQPCFQPTDEHMQRPYADDSSPIGRTIRAALQ